MQLSSPTPGLPVARSQLNPALQFGLGFKCGDIKYSIQPSQQRTQRERKEESMDLAG